MNKKFFIDTYIFYFVLFRNLGIPNEMWDKPSAEITHLKSQCETLLENYEDGKIKLTLEDGSVVDIDADKVLAPEKIEELKKKKKVLNEEKVVKRQLAQAKSELYSELLKFSAYLNDNGHFGDNI